MVKRFLLCEIALSIAPAAASTLYNLFYTVPLPTIIGPLPLLLALLDVCCCALTYHFVYYRRSRVTTAVAQAKLFHQGGHTSQTRLPAAVSVVEPP